MSKEKIPRHFDAEFSIPDNGTLGLVLRLIAIRKLVHISTHFSSKLTFS